MPAPESNVTKDQASEVEKPTATETQVPPPRPPGKRRSGGVVSKLVVSTLALLVVLGAAGYGALTFRNMDPRIDAVANHIDAGLVAAQGAVDKARGFLDDLTGSAKPASKAPSRHALLDKAPLAPAPAPPPAEIAPNPPPPAPPEVVKEPEKPVEEAPPAQAKSEDIPEPAQKPVESVEEAPASAAPPPPPPPAPAAAPVEAPPPPAPAAKAEAPDADGFTDRDLISALEGRIEAMSDEIQALRQKLEAPKSEGRAAPQTEVSKAEEPPKPAPVVVPPADTSGAAVVVAFALQRELEAGKPFAEEIAALSRLDAEPAPAPVLIELSEKGAPTGAQLRESLQAIAKKLEAHETHSGASHEGDLTGQLLESASKLVKVRPAGQAHPESVAGKIQHIETALGRDDFASAASLYDSLPEAAKAESKGFGETLHQRSEAAKAADDLLRAAIAAVGKK